MATCSVAIKTQSNGSCKFVKFVGKKIPWTKKKFANKNIFRRNININ